MNQRIAMREVRESRGRPPFVCVASSCTAISATAITGRNSQRQQIAHRRDAVPLVEGADRMRLADGIVLQPLLDVIQLVRRRARADLVALGLERERQDHQARQAGQQDDRQDQTPIDRDDRQTARRRA